MTNHLISNKSVVFFYASFPLVKILSGMSDVTQTTYFLMKVLVAGPHNDIKNGFHVACFVNDERCMSGMYLML